MKIKIVTESGSDITQAEAREKGITVLPLTISFDSESFEDGVTIDHKTFYNRLIESDTLPKTSQVTPYAYETAFREALEENDCVICIAVSSKLSGCYQSAMIAAEEFGDKVRVVDSLNAVIGERLLVDLAVKLANEGKDADEIVRILEEKRSNVRVIALLDTLEYLKKGGRISAAVAMVGGMLSIKPVVTITDGEILMLGKARGSKTANNKLTEFISSSGPIDMDMDICLAYSGLNSDLLDKYVEDSQNAFDFDLKKLPAYSVGAAIGTHTGPGVVGAAFFAK